MYDEISEILLFLCVLVLGGVLWRVVSLVSALSHQAFRFQEYEHRDLSQFIERLLEKRDAPDADKLEIARRHAQERHLKNAMDAGVEEKAVEKGSPRVRRSEGKPPIFSSVSPEEALPRAVHQ